MTNEPEMTLKKALSVKEFWDKNMGTGSAKCISDYAEAEAFLAGHAAASKEAEVYRDLLETGLNLWLDNHPNSKRLKQDFNSDSLKNRLEFIGVKFDPTGYVRWALQVKEALSKGRTK